MKNICNKKNGSRCCGGSFPREISTFEPYFVKLVEMVDVSVYVLVARVLKELNSLHSEKLRRYPAY